MLRPVLPVIIGVAVCLARHGFAQDHIPPTIQPASQPTSHPTTQAPSPSTQSTSELVRQMQAAARELEKRGLDPVQLIKAGEAKASARPPERNDYVPDENPTKRETHVRVFYATDRVNTGPFAATRYYGRDTRTNNELVYGVAQVTIPPGHERGHEERPSWWERMTTGEDPEKHIVLVGVGEFDREGYFSLLSNALTKPKRREALVFVHGFNVTFEAAAMRLAQIVVDLPYDGVPVLYSWPSRGEVDAYVTDEETAVPCERRFAEFLRDIKSKSQADVIHIVAHSMGARITARALAHLAEIVNAPLIADQVVLAAADMRSQEFMDTIAGQIGGLAKHYTIYCADGDYALVAAQQVQAGFCRLGLAGTCLRPIAALANCDVIDATSVATGIFPYAEHSYYGDADKMLDDLNAVLKGKAVGARALKKSEGCFLLGAP